jgi:anoctamin-10
VRLNVKQLLSLQERLEFNNVMLDNKELIDEYMYLAIQFGYITMFSPVFPIAPLFAMINIYVNLRLSLYTYQNLMKREPGEPADGIGMYAHLNTNLDGSISSRR